MTPFRHVPQQVASNPVARSIANKHFSDAVKSFQTRLYLLNDGEECESDATAAMQVMAVLSEGIAIERRDVGSDASIIRGAMSCLVQVAKRGFTWRTFDAPAIDVGLTRAVEVYRTLKAQTVNEAWRRVMDTNRRIHGEAA